MLTHRLDRFTAVTGLGHDRDVRFGPEDHPEAGAHESFVVGEDDPDGHDDDVRGNRARMTNPPPGRTSVSSRPS